MRTFHRCIVAASLAVLLLAGYVSSQGAAGVGVILGALAFFGVVSAVEGLSSPCDDD